MTHQAPPTPPSSYQPPLGGQRYYPPPKRRKWPWVVGGVVVLFIIISIANSPSTPPPTTVPATEEQLAQQPDLPAPVADPPPAEPAAPAAPAGPVTSFGEGTYAVGRDVVPGTYRTSGPVPQRITELAICYWERLKDTSGNFDSIIANDLGKGPATVTISPSDGAFKTSGCQTWQKVD